MDCIISKPKNSHYSHMISCSFSFILPKVQETFWCFISKISLGKIQTLIFIKLRRKGTLIIFAVLSGLAGLATFRLPDTKGVLTPASAEEVPIFLNMFYFLEIFI